MSISARDHAILRDQLAEKIAQLEPLTALPGWRKVFEQAVTTWRLRANGAPESSEARDEYLGWSLAHQLVLDEREQS